MSIHARIARIATELARAVLVELRRLSPADLHALTFGPSRRKLPPSRAPAKPKSRRGARAALERDLDRVLGALRRGPMRPGQILSTVGMPRSEWPKVVELGLRKKVLTKTGNKRTVVYMAR